MNNILKRSKQKDKWINFLDYLRYFHYSFLLLVLLVFIGVSVFALILAIELFDSNDFVEAIVFLVVAIIIIILCLFMISMKVTLSIYSFHINQLKESKDIEKLTKLAKRGITYFSSIVALGSINSDTSRYALITLLQFEKFLAVRRITAIVLGELKANDAIIAIKDCLEKNNDNRTKFTLAFNLARLEESEGEGYKIMKEMKEKGKLELAHLGVVNDFTNYLYVKELMRELDNLENLHKAKKGDIGEKEYNDLLEDIKSKLLKFSDSFIGYTEEISDLDVASNFLKNTIKRFEESPSSINKIDSISKVTSITNSLIEIEKARKAKESWLSKNGGILLIAILTTIANVLAVVLPIVLTK